MNELCYLLSRSRHCSPMVTFPLWVFLTVQGSKPAGILFARVAGIFSAADKLPERGSSRQGKGSSCCFWFVCFFVFVCFLSFWGRVSLSQGWPLTAKDDLEPLILLLFSWSAGICLPVTPQLMWRWDWTHSVMHARQAFCQLSYVPIPTLSSFHGLSSG